MKFTPTPLPGVILVDLDVFPDARGAFLESYHQKKYADGGIHSVFVQDNISISSRDTLRGLHAQLSHPQAKLVQPIMGDIWDVAVDVRPDSPTYKKWYGVTLSAERPQQLFVPIGFAHGFCVLSEKAVVAYKCSDLYDPSNELHLIWNDPAIGVNWPVKSPVLSKKDASGVPLAQLEAKLAPFRGMPKSK